MKPSFQYKKYDFLDNTELFSSENETSYFPFHFHDSYCISLITTGTELFLTPEKSSYAVAGSISITQANEVHKNSSLDNSGYSYQTCYVSPDVLTYFNQNKKIEGLPGNINDTNLFFAISELFNGKQTDKTDFELVFRKLTQYALKKEDDKVPSFELLDELASRIPFTPFSLDWLCREFCMSKFHFIRVFKKAKGITPQAYVLIKRLEQAKRLLLRGEESKEVALLTGFYDVTHLNTAFKRFFGINLMMIKNSNIIQ